VGGLSVASPYSAAALGFDVIFRGRAGGLDMFVSRTASRRLTPEARTVTEGASTISGKSFLEVKQKGALVTAEATSTENWQQAPLPFQLATYGDCMREIRARITAAFGRCRILVSETSPLPFPVVG
jgi:hypothetical protein